MKKSIIIITLLVSVFSFSQQLGIGIATPASSAQLDVTSTTRGLLPPRMTNAQRLAIVDPVSGSMLWCTDCTTSGILLVYNGTAWTNIDGTYYCGAYVFAGVWKQFMCHNLGADTSLNPNSPAEGLHGNYYQWGYKEAVATPYSLIGTWNTTSATSGAWGNSKTITDPCPTGFKVPDLDWSGVFNQTLNTLSRTGSWQDNGNFTTAIHVGPSLTNKTLTLPAAGYRDNITGTLLNRGLDGNYWCSSERVSSLRSNNMWFNVAYTLWNDFSDSTYGFSVRCISE